MKAKDKVLVGDREAVVVSDAKGGWVEVKYKDDKTTAKLRTGKVALKNPPKPVAAKKAKAEGDEDGRLIPAKLENYVIHDTVTAGGRKHLDIDDEVAAKLREKTLDQVYSYAAKTLGVEEKELRHRYAKLNVGMQRMNLGNRVRAAFKAAEAAQADFKKLKTAA